MIVFLSIDSAKIKRKQTSISTFLAKKVSQGKAIYVYKMSACRSNVTVYTITIQFRIDERQSHHDIGNEGNNEDIKLIALLRKLCVCAHAVVLLAIEYMHTSNPLFEFLPPLLTASLVH